MFSCENWDQIQKNFKAFWKRENERPLVNITGIRDGYVPRAISAPSSLAAKWENPEYVLECTRESIRSTYWGGDSFPMFMPNLGPDIIGAILGDDIIYGEGTSWSAHRMTEAEWGSRRFVFDENNLWWKKLAALTQTLVEGANGEFFVGLSDFHPGCDALVSLRGPENLCFDLRDYPDEIKRANAEIFEVLKQVAERSREILMPYQEGTATWMSMWHPCMWYVTSCDFNGLISPEDFETFVAPDLTMQLDWLDASVYHLDGPAAIRTHLDRLLAFEKLDGVQVCYGAGAGRATDWIDAAKKVQAAGKCLNISASPEDLDVLLSELRPQGLYLELGKDPFHMTAEPFTQEEVDTVMKRWFS